MAAMSAALEWVESVFSKQGKSSLKKSRLAGPLSSLYLGGLVPVLLLVCYGTVIIWSASGTIPDVSFTRHLLGVALGTAFACAIWRSDYRVMQSSLMALFILIVGLILLPNVPGFGIHAKGMTGWVKIPLVGLRFQPSEIVKVLTIFLMAGLGAEYNGKIDTLNDYLKICSILAVIFVILIIQDLGTGLIVFVVGASIIIMSGAKRSWVLITIGITIAVAALVVGLSMGKHVPHALKLLKPYQLKRLLVFVDPSVDPAGDGYHLLQAKIAVGSGGLLGKGMGNASQAWSGFLPEAHTDFVFALLAEEFGLAGSTLLLAIFGWAIFSTIGLARRFDSPYPKLLLTGIATMWTFQMLQNVGMCLGVMPITGIPLPFISFGSSSMVVQLSAAGIIQSIWYHRQKAA